MSRGAEAGPSRVAEGTAPAAWGKGGGVRRSPRQRGSCSGSWARLCMSWGSEEGLRRGLVYTWESLFRARGKGSPCPCSQVLQAAARLCVVLLPPSHDRRALTWAWRGQSGWVCARQREWSLAVRGWCPQARVHGLEKGRMEQGCGREGAGLHRKPLPQALRKGTRAIPLGLRGKACARGASAPGPFFNHSSPACV